MRTHKGTFGLRLWKDHQFKEYFADRFQKALLDEDVVVFRASSLGKYVSGPGLHLTRVGLESDWALLADCKPMPRRRAEEDYTVIQLVSVFVLKLGQRYLTYKRTKRLPESRLHGRYSLAFGGHLNPRDIAPMFGVFQPELSGPFLRRELSEEVRLPEDQPLSLSYRGLLYDNSVELSSQHLGIVYDVILGSENYEIGERGFLMDPKLETLDQIEARLGDFENWSVLIAKAERSRWG